MLNTRSHRFARDKPLRQRADVTDSIGLVTEIPQCRFDRRDRLRMIELRRLFLSVSFGEVIVPEVVCYADFHAYLLDSDMCIETEDLLPAFRQGTRGGRSQWMTLSSDGQSGYRKTFPS